MVTLTTVDERIRARVVIAPPIVDPLAAPGSPVLALVPRHDQFAPPERVIEATADWPDVEIKMIESADHFLAGHTTAVAERATEWLSSRARYPPLTSHRRTRELLAVHVRKKFTSSPVSVDRAPLIEGRRASSTVGA